MKKILFVEDEKGIREHYSTALKRAGFDVTSVGTSTSALQHFEKSQTDLVLLDIALDEDTEAGFQLCSDIRAMSDSVPIIFLTSFDSDMDKSAGMRLGADDYFTKDINIDYLMIRIKALLRRHDVLTGKKKVEKTKEVKSGDIVINMDTLTTTWKGLPVELNLTQLWMVHALVSNKNYTRTPRQLMDAANITIQQGTVVVHIKHIRKLFRDVDAKFSAIKTERGVGYRWVEG